MSLRINTVNLRHAKDLAVKVLKQDLALMLLSSPGIGKSSLARQIAEEHNLEFIDIRLATHEVCDLTGLPKVDGKRAEFLPFNIFPLEDDSIPEGKKGWLILLDELTSCPRSMQVAAYRLLLDREVGQYKVHPNCYIMAAGNRMEDNAVTNELSTALKSRMITLRVDVDPDQWIEDFAIPNGIDHRIIGFVKANPQVLSDFDPTSEQDTFCSPRTLEFLSKLIKDQGVYSEDIPLIAGTIGDNRAGEFVTVCTILDTCKVTMEDIMKDPFLADMPTDRKGNRDTALDWMFITSMAQYVTDERIEAQLKFEQEGVESQAATEFQNIMHYSNRFEEPLRLVFLRMAYAAHKNLLACNELRQNLQNVYKNIESILGEAA